MKTLQNELEKRILILDGAMGTMIQRHNLAENDYRGSRFVDAKILQKGNNDLLVLTQPEIIKDIHCQYLTAGADIIETNSFNAQRISMEDYGMTEFVREINLAAARLARAAADEFTAKTPEKPRFVAGSVGPTNKTASLSPDVNNPAYRAVTFDNLAAAYEEQIVALIEGGVDAILIETIFDTLNAKAAIFAAENAMEKLGKRVEIMLSATVADKSGRTLSGQTIAAFLASVSHANLLSIGLNCSFGARDLKTYLQELSAISPFFVSAYPNAGLPNQFGQYDETPDTMAAQVKEYIDEKLVNIIGGCCGTTPAHIAALAALVENFPLTRQKTESKKELALSGLEVMTSPLTPLLEERGTAWQPSESHANFTTDPQLWHLLIERAKQMRHEPTEAENRLWQELRNSKTGHKIRRQHIVDGFIADFICIEKNAIIEIDGDIHLSKDQQEYDECRTKLLNQKGFQVFRFENEEVIKNSFSVANKIQQILDNLPSLHAAAPPLPKERGQGGEVFTFIGERCNVAGSRAFLRLINEKKYDEALSIARKQVEDGALILDINFDDAMLEAAREMTVFLNFIASEPEIARVPVMIDSSKWEVIEAGLKCVQGKSVVNSISLKEGEADFLEKARKIRCYGAAAVVMAFDERGQADSFERKIEICSRAYQLLTEKINFPPQDIIFDPNILAIATGIEEHNNYAVDFINATKWIKQNLPYAKVSGGVSNLSFSFRGNNAVREAMHSAFLYHAIRAGMDMGIVNAGMLQIYEEIPPDFLQLIENVIFNKTADATEKLIEYANEQSRTSPVGARLIAPLQEEWRTKPLEERLQHALIKGIGDFLTEDLAEALQIYSSPIEIIEKPLMAGMNTVGELFGQGKMFLPQVVKTARTMKQAVAILQPEIEKTKTAGAKSSAGKYLIATVKGDVHDIGKNIVSVILACNNFEVIDLGVMTPTEKIIETAIAENVDIVGLSGLITPSLDEMCNVATEMERAGLKIPLLIGGATTSELHTAVKISPLYNGAVIYVKDASLNTFVTGKLLNDNLRENFVSEIETKYENLRTKQIEKQEIITFNEAKKHKPKLF